MIRNKGKYWDKFLDYLCCTKTFESSKNDEIQRL